VHLATLASPPPFGMRQKLIAQPRTPINSAPSATSEVLTSEQKENGLLRDWILDVRATYKADVDNFLKRNKEETDKKHWMTPKEWWCPNGEYLRIWKDVAPFLKYVLLNVPIEGYIKKE
jgi:hypothetical protein